MTRAPRAASYPFAAGPHLHFELLINGQYVDPLSIAKAADNVTIDASSRSKFAALSNSARLQLELAETLAGNRPQSE